MSRVLIARFVTAGLAFAGTASAETYSAKTAGTTLSKEGYVTAKANADAQYKVDKEACTSLAGNAKDICMAQAKGKDNVAKADAQAAFENTPKARQHARTVVADANYAVANEKCDDLAGNAKDVCVKEAKAVLVKGKADAKVDRVMADSRQETASKQAEAVKEAGSDKRDADYKVAVEKCDALAGAAKDSCVSAAKAHFDKS